MQKDTEETCKKLRYPNEEASYLPCSIISTKFLKCGKMAQPIKIAICWTILIPVCLACHDFLLRQTAFKNGNNEGIPRAEATTAKALQETMPKFQLAEILLSLPFKATHLPLAGHEINFFGKEPSGS